MALHPEGGPAPYAPPSAIVTVIEGFRNRGLQTPITQDVLTRAGITEALAPRTSQALKLLDLIGDDEQPSPELQALRVTPSDEYRARLADLVRAAYAPIFAFCDPAEDSHERVRDAFRPYVPVGQQGRMVTLFYGLCQYAGIIEEGVRRVASARPNARASRPDSQAGRRSASSPSRQSGGNGKKPQGQQVLRESLFTVTEADIADMDEEEFAKVWAVLGKLARARAKRTTRTHQAPED